MSAPENLRELVESSDLDGLVRYVDRTVESRDWDGLVLIGEHCREATERGKQLWGVAEFVDYRLALDAPAERALEVVRPGAGRYANGPLWEVAASTHTWAELAAVSDPSMRALIGHERVVRGDDVEADGIDRTVVDAPLIHATWEPGYPTAVYRSDRADFPESDKPPMAWTDLPDPESAASSDNVCEALLEVVRPWLEESSGRGEAVATEGSAEMAIRLLGPRRVRVAEVELSQAMGAMCWAGASGGAFGRRRGTPVGRALAWWALATVLGLDDDWPVDGDELGAQAADLRWLLWDPGDGAGGWSFHLAVEDPLDDLAWAVSVVDAR